MSLRDDLQRRIDKKKSEIASLKIQFENELREANGYLQALEDTMKILPREAAQGEPIVDAQMLRVGSNIARARQAILDAGEPLHILRLLEALGKPQDAANRAALSGSLSAYVRKGQIFTRPSPNTFGVIELNGIVSKPINGPPPNFGLDDIQTEDEVREDEPDVPF